MALQYYSAKYCHPSLFRLELKKACDTLRCRSMSLRFRARRPTNRPKAYLDIHPGQLRNALSETNASINNNYYTLFDGGYLGHNISDIWKRGFWLWIDPEISSFLSTIAFSICWCVKAYLKIFGGLSQGYQTRFSIEVVTLAQVLDRHWKNH